MIKKILNKIKKYSEKDDAFIMRIVLIIFFVLITTLLAWQSDDAYHGYVMAKHLVEGDGFVYNIGQRASASTAPLFTLIISLAYFITREMFFTSIFVCVILSAAAYGIISFVVCKNKLQVITVFVSLIGSTAFVSYTTSGLENCLLFFLSAVFMVILFKTDTYDCKQLFKLAFIFSLLAMARMDAVLIFIPVIVYAFLRKRRQVSFPKAVLITITGLMPFFLWELFSVFYFGFFVPNTAFVKLGAGIPTIEYIKKGIWYIYYTGLNDLMVIMIPFVYVVIANIAQKWKNACIALGIIFYGIYIVYIGGDFMMGRHFTLMHFISTAALVNVINENSRDHYQRAINFRKVFHITVVVSLIYGITVVPVIGEKFLVNGQYAPAAAISDERAYYSPTTGFFENVCSLIKTGRLCIPDTWNYQSTDEIRENGWHGNITENSPGILVYYNSDIYLNDTYCLGDPFLSKLPAKHQETWRVGHLRRQVPEGYYETVMYNRNELADENLSSYYEIIKEMTEAPLFDSHRIRTVINWNLGKYDYLIRESKDKAARNK